MQPTRLCWKLRSGTESVDEEVEISGKSQDSEVAFVYIRPISKQSLAA